MYDSIHTRCPTCGNELRLKRVVAEFLPDAGVFCLGCFGSHSLQEYVDCYKRSYSTNACPVTGKDINGDR